MSLEKIFCWIWRINGLIVLSGSVVIVGIVLFELVGGWNSANIDPVVTNVADDPEGSEKWVLGRPQDVHGSSYMIIPLVSENDEVQFTERRSSVGIYKYSGSSAYPPSKNILFVNRQTDEMKWLFDDVGQFITGMQQLPEQYDYSGKEGYDGTEFIVYTLKAKDTDGDGVVKGNDRSSIAYTLADGSGYQLLLESFDKVLSTTFLDNGILSVLYQISGTGYLAKYSLAPFSLISNIELPKVGE